MAIKAINNTAGPNSLILILLIFSIYPRISEMSLLSPSIMTRATAIHKVIKELSNIRAHHQVKDILAMQNSPNITPILQLSLNNNVIV